MAAEATKSSPSPDSYIGSLISLTSKSEIRYEGILYNINTEESSIGLRNVRSFGTEGRKKDGQQIPASDKIYEFILFRGSDIKDLQVKASPPSLSTPMQTDPAIIQSHYSHSSTTFSSLSGNFPSLGNVSASQLGSNTAYLGVQNPLFQGSLPTYQTGGSFVPWSATTSPPMVNVSGLPTPMYWQGYYANSGRLPHVQQSSLIRPPPGLAMPPMQQVLQFQSANAPSSSGSTNFLEFPPLFQVANAASSSGSSNYPEFPSLFPPVGNNISLASTSISSTPAPIQITSLTSEVAPFPFSNKVPATSPSATNPSIIFSSASSLTPIVERSTSLPQCIPSAGVSSKLRTGPAGALINQSELRSIMPIVSSSSSKQAETPVALVTPDYLMQPNPSVGPSSRSLVKVPEEVEIKPPEDRMKPFLSKETAPEYKAKTKPTSVPKEPILPLPSPAYQKPNGTIVHATESSRGLERGIGNEYAQPIVTFPGEFDFVAMNEKFNKDEVWGNIGKKKAHSGYRKEEEDDSDNFYEKTSDHKMMKPVYVKEDFFDTLSSNTNQQTNTGRIKFSEQLKIDTETFGAFQRNQSTYRGRGFRGSGGRGRSMYSGRSYGYSRRGRGHG